MFGKVIVLESVGGNYGVFGFLVILSGVLGVASGQPFDTICPGKKCAVSKSGIAKLTYLKTGNTFSFKIQRQLVTGEHGYVALGISQDVLMGDDFVVGCIVEENEKTRQLRPPIMKILRNKPKREGPEELDSAKNTIDLKNSKFSNVGGVLSCEFELEFPILLIDKASRAVQINFTSGGPHFAFLAYGCAMDSAPYLMQHDDKPLISTDIWNTSSPVIQVTSPETILAISDEGIPYDPESTPETPPETILTTSNKGIPFGQTNKMSWFGIFVFYISVGCLRFLSQHE